ncbi:arsenite efflux transporter metallochaperone ArsD [Cytobacillus sp. NCCP-133]|uniref:arsenite efflux transporter metallochaperone ArsD n=1 Tax=Cytobacillus sp. NCCP-133 TaxID=766848 RepID=UPI0022312162|nr:arsenite efflux transporter metallochaperone ArsD [Cytobacillus sp. NCCP-133]GLB59618.1 arsenical resistance operon transcriptional repressor ArsD [Cytobacillus sp. NCCP-133]
MNKVEVFDPALCCPTGVCGPSVDPELTRMAAAVFALDKKGYEIKRYNLGSEPAAFADNNEVNKVLQDKGPDALPVTLLNGAIIKEGKYPSNDELAEWFGIKAEELAEKKSKVSKKLDLI